MTDEEKNRFLELRKKIGNLSDKELNEFLDLGEKRDRYLLTLITQTNGR